MKIAVLKETFPGERRVALTPTSVGQLKKAGFEVYVEHEAGTSAGFLDEAYHAKGATLVSRSEAFAAEVLVQVRCFGANQQHGAGDLRQFRANQVVIGLCDPLGAPDAVREVAGTGVSQFSLELVPRITRAQSMDILSSQATIAGYRAVLLAAIELPKILPLMMTAAGMLKAARVFVIGAGVAGLQAISTARRLGGVVQAYDVRPACREQVESVGGKFVELPLENQAAEGAGGYARAMDEAFYAQQRALMERVVAESDIVITTAAIPGKKSPVLVHAAAVAGMAPGSVIVDLAAERGGNCELTKPDQRVVAHGVTILGPTNPVSDVPNHASLMFSNNVTQFLSNLILKDGTLNSSDEIVRETQLTGGRAIVHHKVRELLQLGPIGPMET